MRSTGTLFFAFVSCAALAAACGGDDGGDSADADDITVDDGDDTDDVTPDAPPVTPDAPGAALVGLGEACGGSTQTPCSNPEFYCLSAAANGPGFCSPLCADNASGTTNANGQFTELTPAPTPQVCADNYTGTVGEPSCGTVIESVPAAPLTPNTAYTGVKVACVIQCGANDECPTGLSCKQEFGGLCVPF